MSERIQTRPVMLAAMAALLAVLVPASLAVGTDDGPVAAGDPSYILLKMGSTDVITWGDLSESINTHKNRCNQVSFSNSPDDILDITADGGVLGHVADSLGVQSSGDGNGTSCGQVEASDNESLSISLGDDLDGQLMSAIDVDLELKFNASIRVTFKLDGETVHVLPAFTGTGGSDDGPDSGDNDNYRLLHRPMNGEDPVLFDEVVFKPTSGAMSLEGGSDGTDNGDLVTTSNASQFEVVQSFDGQITCQDMVVVQDEGAAPGVTGVITMQSMHFDPMGEDPLGWYLTGCLLKLYNDDVTPNSLLFAPELEGTEARYTMVLTLHGQTLTSAADGQVTSLDLQYNNGHGGPDLPMKACLSQPGTGDFWAQDDLGLLPAGHFACYYDLQVSPEETDGEDVLGTETWHIFFLDDPGLSWK